MERNNGFERKLLIGGLSVLASFVYSPVADARELGFAQDGVAVQTESPRNYWAGYYFSATLIAAVGVAVASRRFSRFNDNIKRRQTEVDVRNLF